MNYTIKKTINNIIHIIKFQRKKVEQAEFKEWFTILDS
jgi:hypothetical protein